MNFHPEFFMEFPKLCLDEVLRDVQFWSNSWVKNQSGTCIYLSKLLSPPKVLFHLSFYRKSSLGK